MRHLAFALAVIGGIAVADGCTRTDTITLPGTVDTLIVQRPGRVDTIVVVHPDTVVVTHPETTFVHLPGRVDTLIRVDTLVRPPRVDTLIVQKVDTVIQVHPETTVVVRPETLIVVQHDTVIVHDTIVHYDTVRLSQEPAHMCLQLPKVDTLFFLTAVDTLCNSAHIAQYYPGYGVYVNIVPNASSMYRGTLLLPGYMARH
jgi:hypothetical protein